MFYDSHTHLNNEEMFAQRQHYVDLFVQAGGKGLVNSGASEFYNTKGIEIAQKSSIARSTLGLHPLECVDNHITSENIKEKFQKMKNLYQGNEEYIVAIGETGIDVHFANGRETIKLQKELFSLHAERAREIGLPLVIHSRDGFSETMDVLKNFTDLVIYFHCRSYSPEEYQILRNTFPNLFIGFCGNVTYKNAQNLRDTLAIIDMEKILIETDAPYLSPQVLRGQVNHPANIVYIYDFIAQEKNLSLQNLQTQIEKNFENIYMKSLMVLL